MIHALSLLLSDSVFQKLSFIYRDIGSLICMALRSLTHRNHLPQFVFSFCPANWTIISATVSTEKTSVRNARW